MTDFLLLGISAGVMSSLMGVFRGIFPQICEYIYFSSPWSKMFHIIIIHQWTMHMSMNRRGPTCQC